MDECQKPIYKPWALLGRAASRNAADVPLSFDLIQPERLGQAELLALECAVEDLGTDDADGSHPDTRARLGFLGDPWVGEVALFI